MVSAYLIQRDETVLERLLREGIRVPNRVEVAFVVVSGPSDGRNATAERAAGTPLTGGERGYFLSCVAKPTEDLTVVTDDSDAAASFRRLVDKTIVTDGAASHAPS